MDFAGDVSGDELVNAGRTRCVHDRFQGHPVERHVELARTRVFIERRGEIELHGPAIGRGDQSLIDARIGLRCEDASGERAEDRVAQSERFRVHLSLAGGLLDAPRDAAFEFEIADELRFVLLDVASRGLEAAGQLDQLFGGGRVERDAQIGIAVYGKRAAATERRSRRRKSELIEIEYSVDGFDLHVSGNRNLFGLLARFAVEMSCDAAVEAAQVRTRQSEIDLASGPAGDWHVFYFE